jgi:hypothetical protein
MLTNGIVTDGWRQKISGYELGALMKKLVEGVLAVRAWFSPDDWSRFVRNMLAVPVHRLSIALHVSLLQVRGKPVHVLIVWQHCFTLCAKEVRVPKTDQGQDNGDVPVKRRLSEMAVHLVSALQ